MSYDEQKLCPKCGTPMRWKYLKHPKCDNCLYVEGQEAEQNCAQDANENALTRSDDAASMQNKAANSTAIRAQEGLPDLKILRDHNDGYLYVWEKVRTQWKMKARYRTWTDVLNSLMEQK